MKLYTQEQVIEMLNMHVEYNYTYPNADSILSDYTPIELPTDEEIDNHVEYDFLNSTEVHKYSEEAQLLMKAMCKAGALWMRDKIQGGEEAKQRAANYMMLKGALDNDSKGGEQ